MGSWASLVSCGPRDIETRSPVIVGSNPTDPTKIATPSVKRVYIRGKLELFSIVGKEGEYVISRKFDICSCRHFYFRTVLKGLSSCQHLESVRMSGLITSADTILITGDEGYQLLSYLTQDYISSLKQAPGGI
jgi:predicted nucleic acid-binding Zn finger protein